MSILVSVLLPNEPSSLNIKLLESSIDTNPSTEYRPFSYFGLPVFPSREYPIVPKFLTSG